ncbi:MAG: RIP metalloprotease RseP [Ardenticatenaceae bacterium]|nr:RIP metalloprotease RseP [Ardenticatenaceae bacterium]HBY93578.1 RIP metalloprotease RseP [Chloroflexota bacterium]
MIVSIVAFIVVLGLLVFVHEFGHFIVAKWSGIKVEEFGFGYPPRLFTFMRRGGTDYTINLLPVGGFVRMLGEEDPTHPGSFASKSRWARAAVLVAGAGMNMLLAVVLFAAIGLIGVPTGDPTGYVEITNVSPGSPAASAGLQSGDLIVYVANQRVSSIERLQSVVVKYLDRPVTVTVQRGGQELDVKLTPRSKPPENQGPIGVEITNQLTTVRYGPFAALKFGVERTVVVFFQIIASFSELFGRLFHGSGAPPVAGPLGIAQVAGELARTGQIINVMSFAAILSINLAILNLLPFPALDGGRLLFVVIEGLRGGRRIDPQKEGLIHLVGMMILLTLMVFISYFDLLRIFNGQSLLR